MNRASRFAAVLGVLPLVLFAAGCADADTTGHEADGTAQSAPDESHDSAATPSGVANPPQPPSRVLETEAPAAIVPSVDARAYRPDPDGPDLPLPPRFRDVMELLEGRVAQ